MSSNGGNNNGGSDAGWTNTQSIKSFNKNERWEGKSDAEVKANIKHREKVRTEEKVFLKMGKTKEAKTPFFTLNLAVNATKGLFDKGSVKTRTFFKNSVLSKKGVTYKGIKMSKSQFENFSLTKQKEVYKDYIRKRMSGETDAYGNVNINYGKGDGNQPTRKTAVQIESESGTETKKEDVEISEDEYKKRRGLIGSRSMFARAGARGFFDSTGSAII